MTLTDDLRAEMERRSGGTRKVLEIFLSHRQGTWIHWRRFQRIPDCEASWRTRISDARAIVRKCGRDIENNKRVRSAYRLLHYQPIGQDAATERSGQRTLFGAGSFER